MVCALVYDANMPWISFQASTVGVTDDTCVKISLDNDERW
jgi:hypothetical protein